MSRVADQEFLSLTEELDLKAFWEENALCMEFTEDKPRCGLTFSPDDHWIFELVEVPSTIRYYQDKSYRDEVHRKVNAMTAQHVGKTFFSEDTWMNRPRRIENLFGSEFRYEEKGTPWFQPATDDPQELARILDRVEETSMPDWALPEPFLEEWQSRRANGKPLPKLGGGGRGPATIMTSVLSVEDLFFWIEDYPEVIARFRDLLAVKMIELNTFLREFSGNTNPGWGILDDNSALFNRALYREYCFPVLEKVMEALAPGSARRHQHSDSNMAHLMEDQYHLGIRSVNYGPEIDVAQIRAEMPDAMIHGHMPPFTLRNADPETIRKRIVSDFEKVGKGGGLTATTAGSLSAGTGVGRMRWFMLCVDRLCRYS